MDTMPDILALIAIFTVLALVPFIAVMATSFVKISVVLSLVRNAIGVQQIPPNMALHGIAIILSLYVMAPIGYEMVDISDGLNFSVERKEEFKGNVSKLLDPYTKFLKKHVGETQLAFFSKHAKEQWPDKYKSEVSEDNLLILIPAFTVTEITKAFEIGFLLYLPFLAIDLIVSNILLALGMMMVSPMTISLPFKLLLFVMLDGWAKLIHGLVMSY